MMYILWQVIKYNKKIMLYDLSVSTSDKVMRNTRSTPFSEILSNIFYCEIVML